MNTKELQRVNREQAKRLKKLGFDRRVVYYFDKTQDDGLVTNPLICFADNHNKDETKISAPTVALALKWIRDEKKLLCFVSCWYGSTTKYEWLWQGRVIIINKHPIETAFYATYEAAESALLDKLLTLLEKEEKR
jgi:hypothetical protein